MKNHKFLKLLALFVVLIMNVSQVWGKVVYYNDNGQTGTPKVYAWTDGSGSMTTWDNSPSMNHLSGNIYYYDIGSWKKVIFRYNNAGSQTENLTVPTDGKNYMATYNATSSSSWSTLTFTVSYNANGGTGTTSSQSSLAPNSSVTLSACGFEKAGYHFAGWNTAANGSGAPYAAGSSYTVIADLTLYAQWVKTIYVLDDASFSTLYLYTWNSTSIGTWPGNGTGTDYVNSLGSNWYEVNIPDGAGSLIINNNGGKQTVDLTASNLGDGKSYHFTGSSSNYGFQEKKLTVSVNMQGHGSDPGFDDVYYNSLIAEVDDPGAVGWEFKGWYKEAGCTNAWNFSTDRYIGQTLYAKWVASSTYYNATFGIGTGYSRGGTITGYNNTTSSSISTGASLVIGTSVTFTATPNVLYEVDGFYSDATCETCLQSGSSTTYTTTMTSDKTVYVKFKHKYAYIQGRFLAYDDPSRQSVTYTGSSEGTWDVASSRLQMDFDAVNSRFYLHTYATPNELTSISSNPGYINIKLSTSSSSSDGGQNYYADDNVNLTAAGTKIGFAEKTTARRPYITSTATNKYVVLYWDGTKMWYEEEDIIAAIDEVDLSVTRVPPTAPITATPTMYVRGVVNKAYCWGVYTDVECTSKVNSVSFTSLGDGKVQFMAPQEQGTYYLKLTVHSTDDCNATIDDEEVVSFTVTTDDMVFFKNVPGWGNVHVYFLGTSDYWDANLGSGCAGRDNGTAHGMTRIGNSDVYYYDYHGNSNVVFDANGKAFIAFTDNYKPNSNNFSECQAVFRGDFSECAAMFVPENWITHYLNNAAYYNRGYWTNYMSASSGFSFYLWDKTANNAAGEITIVSGAELTGTIGNNTYVYEYDFANENNHKNNLPYTYGFKIKGCGGSWYGAEDDMTITKCTDWNLGTDTRKCGISVNAPLPHKFIFTLAGDGHVQVSVEYPVSIGDYRLLYDDNTQTPHPSQFIRKRENGKDTVAMYVRPSETENLKVQYCTGIDGETITWADYAWNNGSAAIDVEGLEDGVYVFYLEQDGSGSISVNTSETRPYTGLYYIRTNCLDGGWNSYKSSSDNQMTYAPYPETRYGFNYYKTQWVGTTGTDVTYTIACDYSPALCDTLVADEGDNPLSASQARSLPHTANIRFGWHSKTNKMTRAYINGSTNVSDRFLVMIGDSKMKDKDGNALAISGLNANEISFSDLNNWIYRCDITAVEGAAVKLTANYDGHVQYFIGTSETPEEILGGTGSKEYLMRVTYDFKTNRLMTAWLPNGDRITDDVELKADMMLIREGQNAATQVYFNGNNHKITEVKTIFGVMEFQYDHIAGQFPSWSSPNAYKYLMYYISFPFNVKVSEIFGAGVRGENWIIQKYNGAKRAEKGWFAETSTFWETMDGSETMNAYEGYLLLLDRVTFNDPSSSIWYKQSSGNSVYLYFPSSSNSIGTIDDEDKVVTVPAHTCTINRDFTIDGVGTLNHRYTDSHWNIMGTPLFETHTASTIGDPVADGAGGTTLKYFYGWDSSDNSLETQSTLSTSTSFKSMHSYMVQYAGDVKFHGAAIKPASVAARRVPSDKKYLIELQMINTNEKTRRTYVELRENAKDTFELNEDMYMVRSSNIVDLYTFAGAYDVAANVLTVNNHIVPVGMDVKQAGTYRFTMPSEFSGTVTLVDTQTGARTNLALGDYEVNLAKGTLNNRFQLEINIQSSTTSLEGNDVKDGGAHKFIENGVMYILRDGKVFNAQGSRVK